MTYNNRNFADDYYSSPTLREFLRITDAKPTQTIVKEAETKQKAAEDPKSFTESLLKLCSDLRSEGFTSYAHTLENKFLLLKQAEALPITKKAEKHLYNVHDETGEDFIEFAHPGGGNNELDPHWDDLGNIETIEERHKKIIDVLNKIPTHQSVQHKEAKKSINPAVVAKIILAQSDAGVPSRPIGIQDIKDMFKTYNDKVDLAGGFGWWPGSNGMTYAQLRDKIDDALNKTPISKENIRNISSVLQYIERNIIPHIWDDATRRDIMNITHPSLEDIRKQLSVLEDEVGEKLRDAGTPYDAAPEAKPTAPAQASDLDTMLNSAEEQASTLLQALEMFKTRAGNDPRKLSIVQKVETALKTFGQELMLLVADLKKGTNFAEAVGKTTAFKGLTSIDQLQPDVKRFFDTANNIFDQNMKKW